MSSGIHVIQEAEQLVREKRLDEAEKLLLKHIVDHSSTEDTKPMTLAESMSGPLLTQAKVALARCSYRQDKFEVIKDYAEDVIKYVCMLEDWLHEERQRQNMDEQGRVKTGPMSPEEAIKRRKERDSAADEDYYMVTWLKNNLRPQPPEKDNWAWLKFWR